MRPVFSRSGVLKSLVCFKCLRVGPIQIPCRAPALGGHKMVWLAVFFDKKGVMAICVARIYLHLLYRQHEAGGWVKSL